MKIAITQNNAEKIEAELKRVNGRSTAHCYTTYEDIAYLASKAERMLTEFLPAKKYFKGAFFSSESGAVMPNCYKGTRNTTNIKMVRGSKEWFLTSVTKSSLWPNQYGRERLVLTPDQDALAINKLKSQYDVV